MPFGRSERQQRRCMRTRTASQEEVVEEEEEEEKDEDIEKHEGLVGRSLAPFRRQAKSDTTSCNCFLAAAGPLLDEALAGSPFEVLALAPASRGLAAAAREGGRRDRCIAAFVRQQQAFSLVDAIEMGDLDAARYWVEVKGVDLGAPIFTSASTGALRRRQRLSQVRPLALAVRHEHRALVAYLACFCRRALPPEACRSVLEAALREALDLALLSLRLGSTVDIVATLLQACAGLPTTPERRPLPSASPSSSPSPSPSPSTSVAGVSLATAVMTAAASTTSSLDRLLRLDADLSSRLPDAFGVEPRKRNVRELVVLFAKQGYGSEGLSRRQLLSLRELLGLSGRAAAAAFDDDAADEL